MMDVAAYRRLQHRMENRGRTASSRRCVCVTDKPQTLDAAHAKSSAETNAACARVSSVSSGPLQSSTAHEWLLQRVQGVEVDITAGDTDHTRRMSCCCSCCSGYHHLSHTSPVTESTRAIPNPTVLSGPHQHKQRQQDPQPSHSSNGNVPSSPALGAMGRMLSAFLRRAEAVPPRQSSDLFAPHLFSSRECCTQSVTPRPVRSFTQSAAGGITLPRRAHSLSPLRQTRVNTNSSATDIAQASLSLSPQAHALPSAQKESAPMATAPFVSLQTFQKDATAAPVNMSSAAPPPELSAQISASAPAQQTAVSAKASAGSVAADVTPSAEVTTLKPADQAVDNNVTTEKAVDNNVTTEKAVDRNATTEKEVDSNAIVDKTVKTDELTSVQVMNALRERLLLENADMYVRGLEQQQQQRDRERSRQRGDIIALLARLQHEDHEMLEALCETVALRESDSPSVLPEDIQDAVEGDVKYAPRRGDSVEKDVLTSSFPKEIIEAYDTLKGKLSPVQRFSTKTVQTEPQPQENVKFSQTPIPAADSPDLHLPLPLPLPPSNVHPSVPSPSFPNAQPHSGTCVETRTHAPAPEVSQPCAGFTAEDAIDSSDSMRAWVDSNFGTTLDPQHRALLQHVLLSREAELQRAAAAEAQCKMLDEKLSALNAPAPQEVSALAFSRAPQQISAPFQPPCIEKQPVENCPSNVQEGLDQPSAISMMQTHDKEMAELRAMQRAHDTRLHELTETCRSISFKQQQQQQEQQQQKQQQVQQELEQLKQQQQQQQRAQQELEQLKQQQVQQELEQLKQQQQQQQQRAQQELEQLKQQQEQQRVQQELEQQKQQQQAQQERELQQHRTERLAGLQAYVGQLRSGAQWASRAAALPAPATTTVQLSAVDSSRALSSPHTASTGRPAPESAFVPRESGRSAAAVSAGSDGGRERALQQLRSDLDAECARFAGETQRWKTYVQSQDQAHQEKAPTLL